MRNKEKELHKLRNIEDALSHAIDRISWHLEGVDDPEYRVEDEAAQKQFHEALTDVNQMITNLKNDMAYDEPNNFACDAPDNPLNN